MGARSLLVGLALVTWLSQGALASGDATAPSQPPAVTKTRTAGAKTIASALRSAGLTDCLRLIEAAPGAKARAADPTTAATVLCPTNQAIKAFAGDMGLTLDELAAQRPDLVDKLVAYHVVPNVKANSSALAGPRGPKGKSWRGSYAVSGDPHYLLRFGVDAKTRGLFVRDAQGRAARVARADVDAGASVVHVLDRVLLSGEYFPDLKAFAAFYAGNFSSLARALNASGLGGALTAKRWNGTLFAPVDAAFAASKGLLAPGSARAQKLKPVLQYHQLPELVPYPGGFISGKAVNTRLAGHKVTVTYKRRNTTDPEGGTSPVTVLEGAVAPEAGSPAKPARIGLPNVYVARGVVHGIDGVLLPAPAKAAPPPPADPAGRRRLLWRGGGGFRGAGGFRVGGGGWGVGGGGRGFDATPRVGDFDGARFGYDRTNIYAGGARAYPYRAGCCYGAGYAGAALGGAAAGAAIGAAARPWGGYGAGYGYVPPTVIAPTTYVQEPAVAPGYESDYEPVPVPVPVPTPVPVPVPTQEPPSGPPCLNCGAGAGGAGGDYGGSEDYEQGGGGAGGQQPYDG